MSSTPNLYVDLGSPYAWLAVERAEATLGVAPRIVPIVLGVIFNVRGWGSWAHTEQRAAGEREVERRAAAYGLPPVVWPPDWPRNTLVAMRGCVWAEGLGRGDELVGALFRRSFTEGADLADLDVVAETAAALGLDGDELRRAVQDPAIKQALRDRTDEAVALGVPGVPTIRVGETLLWGDDRLEDAAALLAAA